MGGGSCSASVLTIGINVTPISQTSVRLLPHGLASMATKPEIVEAADLEERTAVEVPHLRQIQTGVQVINSALRETVDLGWRRSWVI